MNLRANAPIFLKKLIWDLKYGVQNRTPYSLRTSCSLIAAVSNDCTRILELGCGQGSLLKGLRRAGWQGTYCGVDISTAGIRVASEIESRTNSSWIVSDIESFDSNLKWDVIAMIESVYYVNIEKIVDVLNRAMGRLDSGGYLLLRIHNFSKHHHYIDAIDRLSARVDHTGPALLIFPEQNALSVTAAN
jgi:2-polyprenyl-3-methyl-5-hydroxy-6-metoxy-1,4-benzoquinol methylase